jgi:hypothetical protein
MCCKVQGTADERAASPNRMLEHSGLGIVDDDFGRNSAKKLQSVLVSGQEVLCRLAEAKSLLGTQPLEDLRDAIRMLLQPALDDWLGLRTLRAPSRRCFVASHRCYVFPTRL